jgi:hypothetical protein
VPLVQMIVVEIILSLHTCQQSAHTTCSCSKSYPLPAPGCDVKEEIPPSLLRWRCSDWLRQLWILHHPLPELDMPSPVTIVQLLRSEFLENIARELVEDG